MLGRMDHEPKHRAFGSRIRAARLAAGHSNAAQFSRDAGFQPHTLWRYEEGQSRPGVDHLASIARLCGVTMEWLATGEGDGPATSDEAA